MRALEGLDLRVAGGGVFGLLGPNGAGKTTLVKLVLAIAFPTAGRARVLGRTPGDIAAKARIGYLPENHRYPSHLTGKQVLHYFARLSGLRDPERSRRVASLLKRVRMDAAGDVKVHRYSKGMMQRLGMAALRAALPGLVVAPPPPPGTAGAGAAGTGAPGPAAPSETLLQLAGDRAALNRLIDALRAQGAEIDAVVPRRQSLEEVFVRVVGEGEP